MTFQQNDPKKLHEFLLLEKEKLIKQIASLESQDPYSDTDRLIDNAASDTEAKEENSHERMEALGKELSARLEEVNSALLRIGEGSYGTCIRCSSSIESGRLEVNPTALHCLNCARQLEK